MVDLSAAEYEAIVDDLKQMAKAQTSSG